MLSVLFLLFHPFISVSKVSLSMIHVLWQEDDMIMIFIRQNQKRHSNWFNRSQFLTDHEVIFTISASFFLGNSGLG